MSNNKGCDPEYMLDKSVETVRVYFRLYVVETLEKRSLLPARLNPNLMFNRGPISTLKIKEVAYEPYGNGMCFGELRVFRVAGKK